MTASSARMSGSAGGQGLAGPMIRADPLSQGPSHGFPTSRFKWQALGSLHRRFSGCMKNIRATPFERGSSRNQQSTNSEARDPTS